MPNGFSHHVLHKTLTGLVLWCYLFLLPTAVRSATTNSATLQWAANQEPDLAGYRLYHGTTSGVYDSPLDLGNTTTYQFVNLESNATHYFSVTAYDSLGNESSPSPEVFKVIAAPSTPPTLVSPAIGSTLTTSTATFQWNAGSGIEQYYLSVGTAIDQKGDIFSDLTGTNSSQVVSGIPLTGNPVYVRLWWKTGTGWTSTAHTYQTR